MLEYMDIVAGAIPVAYWICWLIGRQSNKPEVICNVKNNKIFDMRVNRI